MNKNNILEISNIQKKIKHTFIQTVYYTNINSFVFKIIKNFKLIRKQCNKYSSFLSTFLNNQ